MSLSDAIARYFKQIHRSSAKRELGRDFHAVQNLCVAYKFLLHKKLVDTCVNEPKMKILTAEKS